MPRPTIFGKLGFRPDPIFAHQELMKEKRPFLNRVSHRHDHDRYRYAKLNFPVDTQETFEMRDGENPNLLGSVRHMASQAFSKTSRLSVPAAESPTNMKNWKRSDPNAQDLARTDGSSVINSNNDFNMFIKTKETPVGWAEKSRSYHNRRSGTQSCSRAQLDGTSRNMNGTGI